MSSVGIMNISLAILVVFEYRGFRENLDNKHGYYKLKYLNMGK